MRLEVAARELYSAGVVSKDLNPNRAERQFSRDTPRANRSREIIFAAVALKDVRDRLAGLAGMTSCIVCECQVDNFRGQTIDSAT